MLDGVAVGASSNLTMNECLIMWRDVKSAIINNGRSVLWTIIIIMRLIAYAIRMPLITIHSDYNDCDCCSVDEVLMGKNITGSVVNE